MIRSLLSAVVLLGVVGGAAAQPDDAPADPSVIDGRYGTLKDYAPGFGAGGALAVPALERIRARATGPVVAAEGVLGEVDFDGPTVVIDGLRYDFAADARVTLRSGFGAPTLLESGMAARYVFERFDDGRNTAGRIHQLEEIEAASHLEH